MRQFTLTALLAIALLAGGCSNNPTSPPVTAPDSGSSADAANLQKIADQLIPEQYRKANAGVRPIWDVLGQDQMIDDPLMADPAAISDAFHDIYSLRIIWGTLGDGVAADTPPVDWSGGLKMNAAGMMVVRSLIDFERDQDSLLPRESKQAVRWKSITHNDFDGIHVLIFHPKNVVYIAPPVVVFGTDPAEVVMQLFALEKLDTVVRVDGHNAVAIQAHRVRVRDCPRGILGGEWVNKNKNTGHFLGKWISSDGQLMGFLGGNFGVTDDGSRVFRGKWVGVDGAFQAHLKGRWGYLDVGGPGPILICPTCDRRMGWFAGHFSDADGKVRGAIEGRFFPRGDGAILAPHPPGTFFGRWKVACPHGADG